MRKISIEKWLIIFTVVSASMLQLIDSSIVNVTLTDIMGSLGGTLSEVGWVITGYAAANVIMITLSGWLSYKMGRKVYFTGSIVVFTIASFLCGHAHSIDELIVFRILQGIGGGGLVSTAQAILIETFPREDIGMANAIFGVGIIIGPALGPTLGGYITDHLNWHWIFYINIPIGAIATFLSITFVRNSEERFHAGKLDWIAFLLLIASIGSLQVVLENGEREDWFSTTYILVLSIVAVLAGAFFIWRELLAKSPILDLKLLRYRRFGIGIFFSFIQGLGQYASLFIIPIFCQSLLGYTATQTGLLLMPGSLTAGLVMPLIGKYMKQYKISPVVLAGMGFGVYIIFLSLLSSMNLNTGLGDFLIPIIIRGVGGGLLFISLTTVTLMDLKNVEMPQGTAFVNMSRQLGGSFGIALMTTFITVRSAFHLNRLSSHITAYNPTVAHRLHQLSTYFQTQGFGTFMAHHKALDLMYDQLKVQSMLLTYNDTFYIVSIFFAICIPLLVLFVKRKPRAQDMTLNQDIQLAEYFDE